MERAKEAQANKVPVGVAVFTLALFAGTIVMAKMNLAVDSPLGNVTDWVALFGFCLLLVLAERLDVRFRLAGQVDSMNLFEAVLAPLMFAFAGAQVMAAVAISWTISGIWRRNQPIKATFNVVAWTLAAGCGSYVLSLFEAGGLHDGVQLSEMFPLIVAMVVAGLVNQVAFMIVVALAQKKPLRSVVSGLSPVILPGWIVVWSLNTLIGMLFVLAYESNSFALLLFWVPLAVLHTAYRGYAGTESDRMRLAGLHKASRLLSVPGDPDAAVAAFLAEVSRCFEATAAELLLVRTEGIVIHQTRNGDPSSYIKERDAGGDTGLRSGLVKRSSTARIFADSDDPLAQLLVDAGWRDCLMAPLPSENLMPGVLVIYDQNGLEGFEEGEQAILEALAREAASSFEKGKLFAAIVEERHKLSQIVDSTSDGVLSLTPDGIVRSWNPGWEQITGLSSEMAIGRVFTDLLKINDLNGRRLQLESWTRLYGSLPGEVQVIDKIGNVHWLQCQYRPEVDDDGIARVLVVVAHDLTDVRQIEQLKEDVDRLAELESAQRQKVLQLQESLQPSVPLAPEAEFGVHYLPSDTSAPTGGDFYDWQILPNGDIHIAVVDVLGSGVDATNDAFSVIHTLRTLAFQGTPVEHLVNEADHLLAALDSELVATIICVRYNPTSGRARLAGGGHPPPLLVSANGEVEEVAAPGIPVGWPGAGSERAVDLMMRPSDTLILYTDGLIEAQRDILQGLEALTQTAMTTRSLPAPELARALVERSLEGADRRDDSLALVIRHCGALTVDAPTGFGYRGRPSTEQVPVVRHQFVSWISQQDKASQIANDMSVVVTELTANAIRAAHSFFEVRASFTQSGIILEVEDDGPGFDEAGVLGSTHNLEDESGRGLMIVKTLVDELHVRSTGKGCVVRLFKSHKSSNSNKPRETELETVNLSKG